MHEQCSAVKLYTSSQSFCVVYTICMYTVCAVKLAVILFGGLTNFPAITNTTDTDICDSFYKFSYCQIKFLLIVVMILYKSLLKLYSANPIGEQPQEKQIINPLKTKILTM